MLARIDIALLRFARTRGHTRDGERAIVGLSLAGQHGAVWFAIGLAGFAAHRANRARWRAATATVGGAYALNTSLKLLVRRERPSIPGLPALIQTPTRLSFPSAHATTSFAGALAFRRVGVPGALLYPLATSMSLSRLYLGVHYPSDVIAGALLGTTYALLYGPPATD